MSTALILGFLWVLAATGVAFLPMRRQVLPGLALLAAAPVLIWFIGRDYSPIPAALAVFAVVSMFRRPLKYFTARALRRNPEDKT
jgi:uncharacterized protein YqgC (DUF456 family)